MSFLLHHNTNFFLVDQNSRYGVFCQRYNPSGISRPMAFQSNTSEDYSAILDANGNLHVICMPTPYRMNYFHYENNHFSRQTLIDNLSETTVISNPIIHFQNNILHIFYLSNQAKTSIFTLVHYNLQSNTYETLLESHYMIQNIKSVCTNNTIYIFYTFQEESYNLCCLKITPSGTENLTLLSSKSLIVDYSFCIHNEEIELCYVWETYGKYELVYCNPLKQVITKLGTTTLPSIPTIFWYYDKLWINYLTNNKLFVILSIDEGHSFSSPILSTTQENLSKCIFYTNKATTLYCSEMYISIQNNIRISTLCSLDFEHIHYDLHIPVELELLFEGLRLSQTSCDLARKLKEENDALKNELASLESKYQSLTIKETSPINNPPLVTEPTSSPTSIKNAATAFMEEVPTWDKPPLI